MKKLLFGLICAICAICHLNAEVYDHTFRFSESDFSITPSNGDSLVIVSLASPAVYSGESQPGIPLVARSLAIPQGFSVHDYSVSFKKRLIRSGIDLKKAARPIPTNAPAEDMWTHPGGYAPKTYPDSNCIRSLSYQIGGVTVAGFIVTPFIFDAIERNLYFIDSLTVSIDLDASAMLKAPAQIRTAQLEMLEAVVDNRDVLGQIPVMTAENDDVEYIDYIIITSNSLKNSFQPLADWKRKKGVRTKIITVEEINASYSEESLKLRIKACIKDHWANNFTQYVLLGGDVDIIPTQHCYIEKSNLYEEIGTHEIPTDLYYSALEDLDWDAAAGGKYGYQSYFQFSFSAVPQIHVTRASVRCTNHVNDFVNRIIEYEQTPRYTRWIFQSGTNLRPDVDGEELADMFFNNVINYKIRLGANKLFDTYSYSGEPLTQQSVKTELQKGYQYVQFFSHGVSDGWCYDDGRYIFKCSDAAALENSGHSLITTISCYTNAFDHDMYATDPCLSETLFRNPKSGIIGFLGSSRVGWYNNSTDFSTAYEIEFHKRLQYNDATTKPVNKNFGSILTFTKLTLLPLTSRIYPVTTKEQEEHNKNLSTYRWLHLSLNQLGDPETPIFNEFPMEFTSASISQTMAGDLKINTGVNDARVCVSSSDGGDYYEIQTGKDLTFTTGAGEFDVWITKQNYKPKHFSYTGRNAPVLNPPDSVITLPTQISSISPNPATNYVTIKYISEQYEQNPSIQFLFTNINGIPAYSFNVPGPFSSSVNEVTFDISHFEKGTYIVNLIENGKTYVSHFSRLIKQ